MVTDWRKVPEGWAFLFYGEHGKGWYGPGGQFNPRAPRPARKCAVCGGADTRDPVNADRFPGFVSKKCRSCGGTGWQDAE